MRSYIVTAAFKMINQSCDVPVKKLRKMDWTPLLFTESKFVFLQCGTSILHPSIYRPPAVKGDFAVDFMSSQRQWVQFQQPFLRNLFRSDSRTKRTLFYHEYDMKLVTSSFNSCVLFPVCAETSTWEPEQTHHTVWTWGELADTED